MSLSLQRDLFIDQSGHLDWLLSFPFKNPAVPSFLFHAMYIRRAAYTLLVFW